MNQNKLPPLIDQMFKRIGLIYEASKSDSTCSKNPYVFDSERIISRNLKLLYLELLLNEIEMVKAILIEELGNEEN
jgi:hypothetical protein